MTYARLSRDEEGWRGYTGERWVRLSAEEGAAEFEHYIGAGGRRLMTWTVLLLIILATVR
jgi:hypothetical protein